MVLILHKVGKCCQELSNFNALMEITSSLNAAAVHRLKNTWKLVNSKYAGWKEEWGKLTLNNYVRYVRPLLSLPRWCGHTGLTHQLHAG